MIRDLFFYLINVFTCEENHDLVYITDKWQIYFSFKKAFLIKFSMILFCKITCKKEKKGSFFLLLLKTFNKIR